MTAAATKRGDPRPTPDLRRVVGLAVLAYVLLASYAIARPSIESLFLDDYGRDSLPWAWLGVAVAATLTVGVYSRYAARVELTRVFAACVVLSAAVLLVVLVAGAAGLPGATFALYLWKDVYVVVLIELFWSVANSIFPPREAKWIYGLFCVMGSLGGISANLAVGPIAAEIGSGNVPWLLFPVFGLCYLAVRSLPAVGIRSDDGDVKLDFAAALGVIRSSRYLGQLVVIIALVQVVITLVDYQFNGFVEAAYTDVDQRTAVLGKVYAAIDTAAIALQLATGVVITLLGVTGTLLGVPALLALFLVGFLVSPVLWIVAAAKIASKALDYSIFRAAKEMLYLPITHREKTQGKAVVDILTYRVAKGATSLLLLGLIAFDATGAVVTGDAIVLLVVWIVLTVGVARRYRDFAGSPEPDDS